MIVKMTKYTLLSPSTNSAELISSLQEVGLMDIRRSVKCIDEHSAGLLEKARAIKAEINGIPLKTALAARNSELSDIRKEIAESSIWGDFDKQQLSELTENGCILHFHNLSSKKFDPLWALSVPIQIVFENGKRTWFISIERLGEQYEQLPGEISAPRPVSELNRLRTEKEAQIKLIKDEIEKLPSLAAQLKDSYDAAMAELDSYLAIKADIAPNEELAEYIDVYEGFAPKESDALLSAELDKLPVYWSAEEAVEDKTPIKLRNNNFIKQFEVLTGMYGMPVYSEFDPTPILGPFFLLFFSICMGDAGYGILLMLISLLLHKKMPESSLGKMWQLILYLGIGTFVIGLVLGTFFGMDLCSATWFPKALKPFILKGELMLMGRPFDIQMIAAICIGVFHICLAMTIKAICYTKRFGFRENLNTWGWLILILGALIIAGLGLGGVIGNEITKIAIIAVGSISALGIFVFNKPGRNPLLNIGSGIWDSYNVATGLLGDVLSYIRLYALGLAGGMLGAAFNNLGGMVLGDGGVMWVFYILILVIGHALNLAMSCLGAFVHPLRLSFVEYFKNSGYEGKGIEYKPLKK